MSDNPRNTQFSGYAKLLLEDLKPELAVLFLALGNKDAHDIAWAESFVQATIAQRAYDFASHILGHATEAMIAECELPSCIPECVESLPDLTKWPERQEGGAQP